MPPKFLRMPDGCGELHRAAKACHPGRPLRRSHSPRRPTLIPIQLIPAPIDNGIAPFTNMSLYKYWVRLAQYQHLGNELQDSLDCSLPMESITAQSLALSLSCIFFHTIFSGSLLSFPRVKRGVCAPESSSKAPPSDRCPTSGSLSAAKSSSSIVLGSSFP